MAQYKGIELWKYYISLQNVGAISHKDVRIWYNIFDKDTAGQTLTTNSDTDAQSRPLRMTVLALQMHLSPKTNALT